MFKLILINCIFGLVLILAKPIVVHANEPVKLCAGIGKWAPYSYVPIINGEPDVNQWKGYSVELIEEIFDTMKMDHFIGFVPWKRCLTMVDGFDKYQEYEVFFDGSYSDQRAEKYLLTDPIYTTQQGYFYNEDTYPEGPVIGVKEDLRNYTICGVQGNNYSTYGLEISNVSSLANSLDKALAMLSKNRCDLVVSSMEPVYGAKLLGNDKFLPRNVKGKAIPGMDRTNFHIFIAKKSPRGNELRTNINDAIHTLQSNGTAQNLLDRYMTEIGIN